MAAMERVDSAGETIDFMLSPKRDLTAAKLSIDENKSFLEAPRVGNELRMGVATGDYDNDGFTDIYVTNYGRNVLYHTNGDGTSRTCP